LKAKVVPSRNLRDKKKHFKQISIRINTTSKNSETALDWGYKISLAKIKFKVLKKYMSKKQSTRSFHKKMITKHHCREIKSRTKIPNK